MLGLPSSLGAVGLLALVVGVVSGVAALIVVRHRLVVLEPAVAAATLCLIVTAASVPYVAWRFVEDLRLTTRLHGYDAAAAGPVQAYLPGYLVDGAQDVIPRDATYATAVGSGIPWASAKAAFPSLALQTLFPRRSVADARQADYVLTWGTAPNRVAPVSRVWVVRRRFGRYPAVRVGRIRR